MMQSLGLKNFDIYWILNCELSFEFLLTCMNCKQISDKLIKALEEILWETLNSILSCFHSNRQGTPTMCFHSVKCMNCKQISDKLIKALEEILWETLNSILSCFHSNRQGTPTMCGSNRNVYVSVSWSISSGISVFLPLPVVYVNHLIGRICMMSMQISCTNL